MGEKGVVGRNVAIALVIVCIILAVGLVGAIVNYTFIINSKDNIISAKDSQLSSLSNEYQNYVSTHHHSDSEYIELSNSYNFLNQTYSSLNASYQKLSANCSELNQEYHKTLAAYANLILNYQALNQTYQRLLANYTGLLNDYNALNIEYQTLMSNYTLLSHDFTALNKSYQTLSTSYADLLNKYEALMDDYAELKGDYEKLLKAFNEPLPYKLTPTIDELKLWLYYEDNTDGIAYDFPNFICGDFAVMLSQHAKLKYWDMTIVLVFGHNETGHWFGHAFNAIICQEGLVYVEPQADNIFWFGDHEKIKEGYWYKFPDFPEYGYIYVESYIEVLFYEDAP